MNNNKTFAIGTILRNNLFLIVFVLSALTINAQNDCAITLKNAESLYDLGAIEKIPELIEPCLKSGFSREEKIRAYRLLILTYLNENNYSKADELMLKLLRMEPEYQINPNLDPIEYINLYQSYRTLPAYSIGIKAGINLAKPVITDYFNVDNSELNHGTYKSKGLGYQLGFKISRYVKKRLEVNTDILMSSNSYIYNLNILNFTNTELIEKQSLLNIPIYCSFEILTKEIRPFISAGINTCYLYKDISKVTRTYTEGGFKPITGSDIDMMQQRKKYSISGLGGVGLKYKIDRGFLYFDLNYNYGLFTQNIQSERFSNAELLYKYFYIDNNFKMNSFSFNIGYIYSFYKAKKKNTPNLNLK